MTTHIPLAHRTGTPQNEPPWKWPFIYSFITVVVIAAVVIFFNQTDRNTKLAGYNTLPTSVKDSLCGTAVVEQLKPLEQQLEGDWETHVVSLNLKTKPIGMLNFYASHRYIRVDSCIQAMQLVSQAKKAATDDEKIAVYDTAKQMLESVIATATSMDNAEYARAIACIDRFKQLEGTISQTETMSKLLDGARISITQSNWVDANLYMDAYTALLKLPTVTPTP